MRNRRLLSLLALIFLAIVGTAAAQPLEQPRTAVMSFLDAHLRGDMGFTPDSIATKSAWLSAGLRDRIAAYFKRPQNPNEAPTINGDPFTNSQEYMKHFRIGTVAIRGTRADVTVWFSDGPPERLVRFALVREGATWRLDDLRYEGGSTLRGLLR